MKRKNGIILILHRIFERMSFVKEKTKEQHHAEWNTKFVLTQEQIEELVQAKLNRMKFYRQVVDKDEFHDLL